MSIFSLVLGPLQTNCYIISDEASQDAIVVDPGFEPQRIFDRLQELSLQPQAVLLTHGHYDHVGAAWVVEQAYHAPVYLHAADEFLLEQFDLDSEYLHDPQLKVPSSYCLLEPEQQFSLGQYTITFRHTPGHTPGSVSYLYNGSVFCGDTLFQEGIGRTDLEGGSFEDLADSIRRQLFSLAESTIVYPGHGPQTSIGFEKENNPFIQ